MQLRWGFTAPGTTQALWSPHPKYSPAHDLLHKWWDLGLRLLANWCVKLSATTHTHTHVLTTERLLHPQLVGEADVHWPLLLPSV